MGMGEEIRLHYYTTAPIWADRGMRLLCRDARPLAIKPTVTRTLDYGPPARTPVLAYVIALKIFNSVKNPNVAG